MSNSEPITTLRALPVGRKSVTGAPIVCAERPAAQPLPRNMPHLLSSFVGREREIAEAHRLLGATRLLTLTGAGGVGKTRLAYEVARGRCDEVRDGVWIVELSAVADPTLVPKAVALALGIREQPDQPLTSTLVAALRTRNLLLVLDNCEHLVEACAAFANLALRACPELQILATSRQPLGINGETVFGVPSLSLTPRLPVPAASIPGPDQVRDLPVRRSLTASWIEPPRASEAVRLFVERAWAVSPRFTLTERNVSAVEEICRRLDGLPLAIELAAARVAVLSPEQIAARLRDRFRLLSGGSRTAPPRYRTLRALIDWSHDLLDERERTLFRRLAVFAGGWTLEAAEAVGACDGLSQEDVLDLLSALVTKSLVLVTEHGDERRYRFLESLREYAGEKLRAAEEETIVCERHAGWFVALAERAEPELTGARQDTWLNRLDRESENLRAARRWALARGDAETVARLGASLWQFWWARAHVSDARELISAIVPLARQNPPTPALARALHGAGALAGTFGEYATSRALLEEGLAVAWQLDDRPALAGLLDSLGRQLFVERRFPEARIRLSEAASIMREIDDRHGLSQALSHLGFLDYLEDRQGDARATYQEGLELAREAGDACRVAEFLDNLGRTFQADGDLEGAMQAYSEAVAIWREHGHGPWLAMALNNLGSVQTLRGELEVASHHLAEALSLARAMANTRRSAFTLAAVATLAAVVGEAERAVRFQSVASAAVAAIGASLVQPAYAPSIGLVDRARRCLRTRAAAEAETTGHTMSLADAVEEALAWLAEPGHFLQTDIESDNAEPPRILRPIRAVPPPSLSTLLGAGPAPRRSGRSTELSHRELEVAALVARGLSNRQIADELVIAEGTAANHVKHILARLVLDSRVQIAAWAIEQGLHRRPAS